MYYASKDAIDHCIDMFLYIFHPSILFCKNKKTQDERGWEFIHLI